MLATILYSVCKGNREGKGFVLKKKKRNEAYHHPVSLSALLQVKPSKDPLYPSLGYSKKTLLMETQK